MPLLEYLKSAGWTAPCVSENGEQLELLQTTGGDAEWYNHVAEWCTSTYIWPSNPTPTCLPRGNEPYVHRKTQMPTFYGSIIQITKN